MQGGADKVVAEATGDKIPRQAILVLGGARSGASALAGMLACLGAGVPRTQGAEDDRNPGGCWESKAVTHFHDRLLASVGSSWQDWRAFDPDWVDSLQSTESCDELLRLLDKEFGDTSLFVVKDPRVCRFVPLWLKALERRNIAPKIVFSLRNPLEVAFSLEKRNGIPLEKALLLWLRCYLDAEAATRSAPRCVQRYEALLEDWRSGASRMEETLGVRWPKDAEKAEEEIDRFLTPDLRHNQVSKDDLVLGNDFAGWISDTYECLSGLAEGRAEADGYLARLDEIRKSFDEAVPFLEMALARHEKEVASLTGEITSLRCRHDNLEEKFGDLKYVSAKVGRRMHELEEGLTVSQAINDQAMQKIELLQSEISAQAQRTALVEQEVVRLAEEKRQLNTGVVRHVVRLTQGGRKLGGLAKRVVASPDYLLPGRRRVMRRKAKLEAAAASIREAGLFDAGWYLHQYPDVAEVGTDPLMHYLSVGAGEGRDPNAFFDSDWYVRQYPDVGDVAVNPLVHYVAHGAQEMRDPGPMFSTASYAAQNPDVVAANVEPLHHFLVHGLAEGRSPCTGDLGDEYALWQARSDYRPDRDRRGYEEAAAAYPYRPTISILMPVYNTDPAHLDAAIRSVEEQIYPEWELCIADDVSTNAAVRDMLESAAARDPRIKVIFREENGHISEATNSAFSLATGEYIGLLDHDDVLREHALCEVVAVLNDRPDTELIYSDEDKVSEEGQRFDPHFKPDFSPDLFRAMNYLNHFTVHRAANIRKVGGWRKGFEGSQDYDINLRIVETVDREKVVHIPKVLYHWRAGEGSTARAGAEKSYAYDAGFRALEEHVSRLDLPAEVRQIEELPFYRVRWKTPQPQPLVSLIIPTRDMVEMLRACVSSILQKTTYGNYEILIVDNGSSEEETLEYFRAISKDPRVRILEYPHPFNYSAINNFAARYAKGSILGLVNNDIEVITPDWLDEMVSQVSRSEIGCVGAKLLYSNDTVQHAGVVLGIGGVAAHSHLGFGGSVPGYFSRLRVVQNCSAVTAACLLVRADIFREAGGLDEEHLSVAFNDVDFCLKVRELGYLNLFTPFAVLYHHESISRGYEDTPEKQKRFAGEAAFMKEKWGKKLLNDPFYSPNLTLERGDFSLRFT